MNSINIRSLAFLLAHRVVIFCVVIFCVVMISGCDSVSPSDHHEEMVVEAYLVGGELLPAIRLSKTIDVDDVFTSGTAAINNASLDVFLLNEDGSVEEQIEYVRTFDEPGKYLPEIDHVVHSDRTYRLEASAGSSIDAVSAETHVPQVFNLIQSSHEQIEYQDPDQWSMLVTQSQNPNRQSVFVFTIESLEPTVDNLVEPYFDFYFEDEDTDNRVGLEFDPGDLNELVKFSSQPVNEGNYEVFPDGTLRVKLPWFAVPFYGRVHVTMSTLDDNLFDFQRYQQAQQGGGLLSPGELPNVLDPVKGGRGIFGSLARVSDVVTVVRD